jgi:hypothetical protein
MISTFLKPILLIALISFSTLVTANQFNNPYQGNVIVSSFGENELKEMALEQVLVKVSGNSDIGSLAETKTLLKKTQQLVSQYGYRDVLGTKYFSAIFDKRKINQSLRDMQQPVWGDTRPTTLIWLINGNELVSEQIISQSNDASLSWSVQQTEQKRGIQVQFPLMDLDDNLALSVSDVRGRFYDQVANASTRYARAHFVVAELKQMQSDKWKLSWQLVQANTVSKQHRILISEKFVGSKSSVTQEMVNRLANYYAGQYAILENQGEKFTQTIHVKGINSLDKLAKLNSVLDNLLAISSYTIVSAEGSQLSIDIKIKGGLESFKNTLIAQPNLQLNTSLPIATLKGAELELEGQPGLVKILTETETNPEYKTLIDEDKVGAAQTEALYFNWR